MAGMAINKLQCEDNGGYRLLATRGSLAIGIRCLLLLELALCELCVKVLSPAEEQDVWLRCYNPFK